MSDWLQRSYYWISSELLTHLGFLLALVFLANLLKQKRSPSSTMAWLLVILLLPYVGVPLYVIFGGRKMNTMARRKGKIYSPRPAAQEGPVEAGTERLLASYGVPPARDGNRIELISSGTDAYRRIMGMIDEARSAIHITTFILGWDEASRALVERLADRAREGVAVRLLIDDLGSWRLRRRNLKDLTAAGARVAFFMPVLHLPFRGRTNLRNHRKLLVIDGRTSLTGGMNLALPYLGPSGDGPYWPRPRRHRGRAGRGRPGGPLRVGLAVRNGHGSGRRAGRDGIAGASTGRIRDGPGRCQRPRRTRRPAL